MKWDPYLTPSTKMKSKRIIKDLHIRPETIKLLEVNIGRKLLHIGLYQTKKLCTAKQTNKMKRQPSKWEKIFVNHVSDKGSISDIYKELTQLNSKKKQ